MAFWNKKTLKYYFDGLRWGNYPGAIMEKLAEHLKECRSLVDICSGPGAFAMWAMDNGLQALAVDEDITATDALQAEAAKKGLRVSAIVNDFLKADIPPADISAAAWCFYKETSSEKALGKMMDIGSKLNIFVQHDGTRTPEFCTEGLPKGEPSHVWEDNAMEENLYTAAEKRGLSVNSFFITCDFGCIYYPGDEEQLNFISAKTGVQDKEILRAHLEKIAVPCPGGTWIPSYKPMKVIWIAK